jgi:hypothetical protein
MTHTVASALRAIVSDPRYGPAALSKPEIMAELVRTYLPGISRSQHEAIVAAARTGLADTLREHLAHAIDPDIAVKLAAATFSSDSATDPDTSRWIAGEIAAALRAGPAQSRPGYVFISYVREDAGQVDLLQRRLESAAIRVWRDTVSLWPGQDWRAEIRRAISDGALVFLACFSRKSASRQVTYQNEELVLAIEQQRIRPPGAQWLIPVRFEDCELPDIDIGAGRTLTSLQSADLHGVHRDRNTDRLVATVRKILDR